MTKVKYFIMIFFISVLFFLVPNISNAAVGIKRNFYTNNGSAKYNFTGLTLDTTHEYEFGLTRAATTGVETWHSITEYTATTATVDVNTTVEDLRNVVNVTDTGYITIKDKTTNKNVLEPYSIDLKTPFLKVSNYTVIPNGTKSGVDYIKIGLRSRSNSTAYYQYEKITNENVINKYKEIKAKNGDFFQLQSILKTSAPNSNWNKWEYWYGYLSSGMNGDGATQYTVSAPDSGLYYMWMKFSGNNLKDIYGCILVDNLQPDIALESISLAKTATVQLGKNITLTPSFNPSTATNKIVTWSSSDESVATVDNAGKITPKKLGSTIITVTSQDGSKKATCTVTVTNSSTSSQNNTGGTVTNNSSNTSNSGSNNSKINDATMATGVLPNTGIGIGITLFIISSLGIGIFTFFKYNNLKGV